MPELRAAIFDMDGLLIDSEPFWRSAEKQAFARVGLALSDELCESTMGYRTDEVVRYWYDRHPWTGSSPAQVEEEITGRVRRLIELHGCPRVGVVGTLRRLRHEGYRMGLASSSTPLLIETVIEKLAVADYFEVVCSAVHEKLGKPDPAVFLTAARRLGVAPSQCFVFEDSLAGVRAARAAQMIVIAVPEAHQADDPGFDLAHLKLGTLDEFSVALLSTLPGPGADCPADSGGVG